MCCSQKSGTSYEESKVGKEAKWLRCVCALANKWMLNVDIRGKSVWHPPPCKYWELSVAREKYWTLGDHIMPMSEAAFFLKHKYLSFICLYILCIGMALFVRGHRWPPNPPVAPQSTGGPLKNRWPLQILAHSFGRILRHLYFTNIWNKLTLTTIHTHTETFMGTSHSLNVYRRKDHSMINIFHKNGLLF